MRKIPALFLGLVLAASAGASAQQPNTDDSVELELLTHSEVHDKIQKGYTSVLIVIGGTEERGPHAVLGGHTIMSRYHAINIARKLGKTLVAPVLPVAGVFPPPPPPGIPA